MAGASNEACFCRRVRLGADMSPMCRAISLITQLIVDRSPDFSTSTAVISRTIHSVWSEPNSTMPGRPRLLGGRALPRC